MREFLVLFTPQPLSASVWVQGCDFLRLHSLRGGFRTLNRNTSRGFKHRLAASHGQGNCRPSPNGPSQPEVNPILLMDKILHYQLYKEYAIIPIV